MPTKSTTRAKEEGMFLTSKQNKYIATIAVEPEKLHHLFTTAGKKSEGATTKNREPWVRASVEHECAPGR